jgi:hypothetical protein
MKEVIDSISDVIKNRLTNSVYGTFFLSWLVFHWNFVYSLFALDPDKVFQVTGFLKNEYLIQRYFNIHTPYFWISWVAPFVVTYLIIRWFPKWFLIDAYSCEEKYRLEKRVIKLVQTKKVRQFEADLEVQTARKVTAVAKQIVEEKKIKEADPSIEWKEEYQEFKRSNFFDLFNMIITSIYQYNGDIKVEGDYYGQIKFRLPQDLLAYAHTNNLITLEKKVGKIELTEKGKFFVKEYTIKQ